MKNPFGDWILPASSWIRQGQHLFTGRGENALKKAYIQKAIAFINSEQELLCLKIRHPEQFRQAGEPTFKSDLHIIPKSKGLGIIALAEIVIALFLTKQVFQRNGKPAHLIQIADAFEKVFNCSFGSIYDQQEKVFDRKRGITNILYKSNSKVMFLQKYT